MNFPLKDVLYILGMFATGYGAFLTTRFKLKEHMSEKLSIFQKDLSSQVTDLRKEDKETEKNLQQQITELKLQLKDLQRKDDLQQQVIDQIGGNMDNLIPKLAEAVNRKEVVS